MHKEFLIELMDIKNTSGYYFTSRDKEVIESWSEKKVKKVAETIYSMLKRYVPLMYATHQAEGVIYISELCPFCEYSSMYSWWERVKIFFKTRIIIKKGRINCSVCQYKEDGGECNDFDAPSRWYRMLREYSSMVDNDPEKYKAQIDSLRTTLTNLKDKYKEINK